MHKNAEYYSNFTVPNIDMKQRNRMPQFNGYYKHFYHKTRSYPYPLNSLRLPNQFRRFFQVNHPTFLNYFFPVLKIHSSFAAEHEVKGQVSQKSLKTRVASQPLRRWSIISGQFRRYWWPLLKMCALYE